MGRMRRDGGAPPMPPPLSAPPFIVSASLLFVGNWNYFGWVSSRVSTQLDVLGGHGGRHLETMRPPPSIRKWGACG